MYKLDTYEAGSVRLLQLGMEDIRDSGLVLPRDIARIAFIGDVRLGESKTDSGLIVPPSEPSSLSIEQLIIRGEDPLDSTECPNLDGLVEATVSAIKEHAKEGYTGVVFASNPVGVEDEEMAALQRIQERLAPSEDSRSHDGWAPGPDVYI